MQRYHHLYHFIIFILSIILCISLPFSSFAAESSPEGGVMAQIMGLDNYNYVRYSYGSASSSSTFWEPRPGINYRELSVAGNKVYTNSSYVNLTRWDSLNYYATIEYKIPLMLGEYNYNDRDPISGNGQFWFSVSKEVFYDNGTTDGTISYTSNFYIDKVFFKGQKLVNSVTQNYEYFVSSSMSPSTLREDFDDPSALLFKYINFDWSYTRGEDSNDDVSSSRDFIDLDYLYIRVNINMQNFSAAVKDAFTVYGLSYLSSLSDQQYQDSIIINLEALQTALDAMALIQQEKFDEVIDLLQSIVDNNKQQQVIQILQDLIQTSPDDPDLPEIDQSDQQTDQIIDRQEQISEALGSVPMEDIDNINSIINPSTIIVNSDPINVQSALKVIYEWDTFIYIITIVGALMLISYILFGKKK